MPTSPPSPTESPAALIQPTPEPQVSGKPTGPPLIVIHVTFNRQQQLSLVTTLPDPEKHSMPFYRRRAQIHKAYSCTWKDLVSLCEIKAGDSYWPVMGKCFDSTKVIDKDYGSGCEFVAQLQQWARDSLADQATSIQDIIQDKTESVEKYHTRLS